MWQSASAVACKDGTIRSGLIIKLNDQTKVNQDFDCYDDHQYLCDDHHEDIVGTCQEQLG